MGIIDAMRKRFNNEARYFCAGFQAELKARGRGIQKKLAEATHISRGMLCDLNKGRTRGSIETHRLLAKALGVKYEDLVERGRAIIEGERNRETEENGVKKPGRQARPEPGDLTEEETAFARGGNTAWEEKLRLMAQKLNVAHEKTIAAQDKVIEEMGENRRLRQEIEDLRRTSRTTEGLFVPPAEAARSAPVMDSE